MQRSRAHLCSPSTPSRRPRSIDGKSRLELAFLISALAFTAVLSFSIPALAQGSPAAGAATFRIMCSSCHTAVPERNSIGPSLYGAFGRKAGQARAYSYSTAMSHSEITWTEENLSAFLTSPAAKVPGTKMTFPGVPSADQRNDLVAFLKSLGASSGAPAN
jgi:cytochrome c